MREASLDNPVASTFSLDYMYYLPNLSNSLVIPGDDHTRDGVGIRSLARYLLDY